jgi:hypothetical protein
VRARTDLSAVALAIHSIAAPFTTLASSAQRRSGLTVAKAASISAANAALKS